MPTTKQFNGKAIYSPSGKAGEYAQWACNFYVGCSNGCEYCYLKKGRCKAIMGGDVPTLKKCFKNEEHALEVFKKELKANLPELQKHGLFFSFTTDPILPETLDLTFDAIEICTENNVPVKILTKTASFAAEFVEGCTVKELIAIGFTLTGHDELEPFASSNKDRIEAMKNLHYAGFKTFASIEPIIDFKSSSKMIVETIGFCDLYKIGLESGRKYKKDELLTFISNIEIISYANECKIYFKDTLLKQAGIERESLQDNCVNRDYNIFE